MTKGLEDVTLFDLISKLEVLSLQFFEPPLLIVQVVGDAMDVVDAFYECQ